MRRRKSNEARDVFELESESEEKNSRREKGFVRTAREHVMDLLARRNHSELEIKRKLKGKYSDEDILAAIKLARERNWMAPPEEIAERVSMELSRKKKGHRYINQYLKSKGLPSVKKDASVELEKAREILKGKLERLKASATKKMARKVLKTKASASKFQPRREDPARTKARQLLANRGFDDEIIRKVISENFK